VSARAITPAGASRGDPGGREAGAVSGLLARVGAYFLEAAEAPAHPAPGPQEPAVVPARAAVLGAPAVAVAVAAACAGELRARSRSPAALLCVWRPPGVPAAAPELELPAARSPAGAATPGAARLAARLVTQELRATACGRLAWLLLEPEPAVAARQFRRCLAVAGAPLVLGVAGPRPPEFEPLLTDVDVRVAVLPADIDPALRELSIATLPGGDGCVVSPLPAGPPRWAAMAGLARLRSLPEARR
jgi:hypothetical protein